MKRNIRKGNSDNGNNNRPNILYDYENRKRELLLAKKNFALENLLRELLSEISSRIDLRIFNQELSELTLKATALLYDLKKERKISLSIYEVILLPRKIIELERVADNIGRNIEFEFEEKKLERIENIISFLIRLFDSFTTDYPKSVVVPSSNELDFLLSIENDFDFKILLIALSKTKSKIVLEKLKEFERDEEYEVVQIAKMLLNDFYRNNENLVQINKKRLNNLISQDKIEVVLKQLHETAINNNILTLHNEVINQLGRISQLNANIRNGFINREDTSIARNKIRMAIIQLINGFN